MLWDILHDGRARRAVRAGAVARGAHAVRRRAEAAGARGAAARAGRGAAARRAGQLPRRARASAGWRSSCASRRRRCCSSRHDRELLGAVARPGRDRRGARTAWVHGGGFATYHEARRSGIDAARELRRRWDEEHERLKALVRTLQQKAAIIAGHGRRYQAMLTRLREVRGGRAAAGAAARPGRQDAAARRAHRRAGGDCEGLELTGLMKPFDLEVFYGERVAVLGSNGSGKSHFLRLLAGERRSRTPARGGSARGSCPGYFAQTHDHPELHGRTLVDILWTASGVAAAGRGDVGAAPATSSTGQARAALRDAVRRAAGAVPDPAAGAGGRDAAAARRADRQPRPGERRGAGGGLAAFDGTVLAVTHDRWFARVVRPVPGVRRRRRGLRGRRARLGRSARHPPPADPPVPNLVSERGAAMTARGF